MAATTKLTADQSFFVYVKDVNNGQIRRIAIPSDVQIGLKDNPAELQLHGKVSFSVAEFIPTIANSGIFRAAANDTIISVSLKTFTPTSSRISVYLPPNPRDGQIVYVKDASGTATNVPIDIFPSNGTYIDYETSKTLETNDDSKAFYWYGDRWRVLIKGGTGGTGGGAPVDATYITLSNSGDLTKERKLNLSGSNIVMTDNGPNSTVSLNLSTLIAGGTYSYPTLTVDAYGRITSISSNSAAPSNASYVTINNEASLSGERKLTAGTGILITDGGANGDVTIEATGTTRPAADNDASYIVVSNTSSLPNERALTAGAGITIIDNGANSSIVISSTSGADPGASYIVVGNTASLANERALTAGSGITITDNGANSSIVIAANSGADIGASYIVVGNTASLPNERALTAGFGISLTDNGANSTVVASFNPAVAADVAASYITIANTSSLPNERKLTAGQNITLTDGGANGNVTLSTYGLADSDASYIVVGNTASLPNERALTAGSGITITDNGANSSIVIAATTAVDAADKYASYIVVGNTASLPNERALVAGTGISITDNGANSSIVINAVTTNSGSCYQGYTTSSVWWNATASWTPFTGAISDNCVDDLSIGITRSGSIFTVQNPGYYYFHSSFNSYGNDAYISLRLKNVSNNSVALQRASYRSTPIDQVPVTLDGVFSASSNDQWQLEYVSSGTVYAWTASNPTPDATNMRTGEVSIFSIGSTSTTSSVGSNTSAGWTTAYEVNFKTQTSGVFGGNNTQTFNGANWDVQNYANAYWMGIDPQKGLQFDCNTNNTDFYNTTRTGPLLVTKITNLFPAFSLHDHVLRAWAYVSNTNSDATYEKLTLALERTGSFSTWAATISKLSPTSVVWSFQANFTSNILNDNSVTTYPSHNVMMLQFNNNRNIDMFTGLMLAGENWPVTSSMLLRGNLLMSTTAFTSLLSGSDDLAVFLGAAPVNSSGNFTGSFGKFKLEYKV